MLSLCSAQNDKMPWFWSNFESEGTIYPLANQGQSWRACVSELIVVDKFQIDYHALSVTPVRKKSLKYCGIEPIFNFGAPVLTASPIMAKFVIRECMGLLCILQRQILPWSLYTVAADEQKTANSTKFGILGYAPVPYRSPYVPSPFTYHGHIWYTKVISRFTLPCQIRPTLIHCVTIDSRKAPNFTVLSTSTLCDGAV